MPKFKILWKDHGIGVLMHKSNVLAAAGWSELSCDGYSIEAVKHIILVGRRSVERNSRLLSAQPFAKRKS